MWTIYKKQRNNTKLKETGDSRHIYQNKLDKACFQHDMANGDIEDLTKGTASDKIFHDKAFNITKNPIYDGYQRGLTSMVYECFDKKSAGGAATLAQSDNLATRNKSTVKD